MSVPQKLQRGSSTICPFSAVFRDFATKSKSLFISIQAPIIITTIINLCPFWSSFLSSIRESPFPVKGAPRRHYGSALAATCNIPIPAFPIKKNLRKYQAADPCIPVDKILATSSEIHTPPCITTSSHDLVCNSASGAAGTFTPTRGNLREEQAGGQADRQH